MTRVLRISISLVLLLGIMALDFAYDSVYIVPLYFIPVTLLAVSTSLEFSVAIGLLTSSYLTVKEILLTSISSVHAGLTFTVSAISFSFVALFLNTLRDKKVAENKKESNKKPIRETKAEEAKNYVKDKSENAYINGTLSSYLELLEAKDPALRKHSMNVANYTRWISKELKLSKDKVQEIYWAALLHDIGKVIIANGVLSIPTNLMSDAEKAIYDQHAITSSEIVVQIPGFYNVAKIIRHHHETFDGKGFPENAKGNNIPLGSRIIAVANVYDKLMQSKAYLQAYGAGYALEDMKQNYSESLDVKVIQALERAVLGHNDLMSVKKLA